MKDSLTNNVWAPEVFYDDEKEQFIVVWSSAIPVHQCLKSRRECTNTSRLIFQIIGQFLNSTFYNAEHIHKIIFAASIESVSYTHLIGVLIQNIRDIQLSGHFPNPSINLPCGNLVDGQRQGDVFRKMCIRDRSDPSQVDTGYAEGRLYPDCTGQRI